MDLLPTLLDFIDQTPSGKNIDGISIKSSLLHQADLPERDVFFSFKNKSFVRSNDLKLVRLLSEEGNKYELYDLSNDLQESNDIVLSQPDVVEELKEKLEVWEKDVRAGVNVVAK